MVINSDVIIKDNDDDDKKMLQIKTKHIIK